MKTYSDLLRDPRWQKKRLEIMQRDGFACIHCGNTEVTLNVHHCYYSRNRMPWDYEDTSLLTLCEGCHKKESEFLTVMKAGFNEEMGKHGAMSIHYYNLAMGIRKLPPDRFERAMWFIEFFLGSTETQDYFFSSAERHDAANGESDGGVCQSIA